MITDDDFNTDDICDGILNFLTDMEITNVDAVVPIVVDTTLRYVVEWLSSTGHSAKAEILESIGEL